MGITQVLGTIIVSGAIWFTMVNSNCEFAFWRTLQYRLERLNDIVEITSDVFDEESYPMNESKSSDSY